MSDRELVFEQEAELDDLLESAGFAEDANDPGEADEYPESDDVIEAVQDGDDADEADGYDEDEPASAATSPNVELEQARVRAAMAERLLAVQAARQEQERRAAAERTYRELQESMTPDEWASFNLNAMAKYNQTLQQTIQRDRQMQAQQQFQAAENDARNYVMDQLVDHLKPNRTELAALMVCETPTQIRKVVHELKEARRDRTAAARAAKREQRGASGADAVGGRGRGAGSPPPKQYANVDELVDSMFQ